MSVNRSRSQNAELSEGMTDGTFKKVPRDRSVVSDPNLSGRFTMPWRYGFEDTRGLARRPDTGGLARTNPSDHV